MAHIPIKLHQFIFVHLGNFLVFLHDGNTTGTYGQWPPRNTLPRRLTDALYVFVNEWIASKNLTTLQDKCV